MALGLRLFRLILFLHSSEDLNINLRIVFIDTFYKLFRSKRKIIYIFFGLILSSYLSFGWQIFLNDKHTHTFQFVYMFKNTSIIVCIIALTYFIQSNREHIVVRTQL